MVTALQNYVCAVAYLHGKIAGATHTNVSFVFAQPRVRQ